MSVEVLVACPAAKTDDICIGAGERGERSGAGREKRKCNVIPSKAETQSSQVGPKWKGHPKSSQAFVDLCPKHLNRSSDRALHQHE